MALRSSLIAVAALFAVSAGSPALATKMEAGDCEADAHIQLIGRNISTVNIDSLRANQRVRILHPDSRVTTDFSSTRLNIHVDRSGVVKALICG